MASPERGFAAAHSGTLRALGGLLIGALPLALGALLYLWLAARLEDRLGALVLTIVLVCGLFLPLMLPSRPTSRTA